MSLSEGIFAPGGRWRGLDLSRSAEDIGPGSLVVADNVALDGEDLVTRPGRRGQFTSALANALRAFTAFGTTAALFVSGGKLYKWTTGATAPVEILKGGLSLSLTSNAVQTALVLGVGFLVDGVGNLVRTDGTTATDLTELDRPDPMTTTTTWQDLLANPAGAAWSQNSVTGSTSTPGSSGAGGTIAPTSSITDQDKNFWDGANPAGTPFWTFEAHATCSPNIQDHNLDNCVELDSDSGTHEWVESAACTLNAKSVAGYARVAVVQYECAAEDPPASAGPTEQVDLIVTPYDSTPAAIAAGIITQRSPWVDELNGAVVRNLIDWRGLSTEPRSFKLKWQQPHIHAVGNQGTDINHVELWIPQMALDVARDADNRITVRQGTVQVWGGPGGVASGGGQTAALSDPSGTSQSLGRLLTAGLQLWQDITSASWVGVRTLAAEILPGSGVVGLRVRLGMRSGGTIYWSEALDIPGEGPILRAGGGWASAELRDTAASLTAVDRVYVEILDDVYVEGLQEGGQSIVFRMGAIRNVGNLPEGRPVFYKLVEMDDAGDATNLLDVVWSDGSDSSPLVEATPGARMARIVLPARKNSGAEYLALYRFGGGYLGGGSNLRDDGQSIATGRLVCLIAWASATFAFGGDTDKGATPRIIAYKNPYVSWTKTGATGSAGSIIIDNTPDSWLAGVDTYLSGREKAPTAPTTIASWDNRLWLGKGADLYGSWRIEAGATSGIYWTRLQLPESADPEAARKGHWERLALPAGDSIQRLIALPDCLMVLTTQRVFVVRRSGGGSNLRGESVPAYQVLRVTDADAAGVVAPLAACEFEGMCWWYALDGLRASDGSQVVRIAPELTSAVRAASSSDRTDLILSPCPASRRLLMYLVGGDGSSALYVYHSGRDDGSDLERGWCRWTTTSSRMGGDIGGVLHLASDTGQIFAMTGDDDRLTPSGGAVAIAMTITTRRAGRSAKISQTGRLRLHVVATASETLTVTVQGDSATTAHQFNQALTAGEWDWSVRPSRSVEGRAHHVTLAVSASKPVRIRGLELEQLERKSV